MITLDVFEKRDPLPPFLTPIANFFHATTRRYVIEREVLARAGAALEPGARRRDGAQPPRAAPALARPHASRCAAARPVACASWSSPRTCGASASTPTTPSRTGASSTSSSSPARRTCSGSQQAVYGNFVLDPATPRAGRPVRHPSPRRQPHRRRGRRQRHPQPGHGQGRGLVRLVQLRPAALLDARGVGVGRRP